TDARDRTQHACADDTGRRLDTQWLRRSSAMKGLDATIRCAHGGFEAWRKARLGRGEFAGRGGEVGKLAAVETTRQGAQRAVAVGAHLSDDAGNTRDERFVARLRGPRERGHS